MIPHVPQGLTDLAVQINTGIVPDTASGFSMANAAMIALLLDALALEAERAIDTRMTDIEELKSLFAELGDAVHPDGHAGRTAFRSKQPASLRLSDVETLLAEGLGLLVPLHAWAETEDGALDRAIWDLLRRHTERHSLDSSR